MGIFIHIAISKSVTKAEWKAVYEETLKLVEAFPLAEKRKVNIQGIDTTCLVPTREREESYGWNDQKTRVGWDAIGDYIEMKRAEDYYLPRDLVKDEEFDENAGDAMFEMLPTYMNYGWNDPRFNHFYDVWGAKTQGEPYHMYLLAIACTIESRLGEKAFVYGDITRGQCKKAVELANEHLETPIDIPDRCDMERFLKRVSKLPLNEKEQLATFERLYLGTQDATFGKYMRQTYSEKVLDDFWKERFGEYYIGTIGFDNMFNDYILWGFDLEKLCSLISFADKEGNLQYEKFVKRVMDTKLHLKEKNCEDPLKIDQEESRPYSVATLFAQFAFAGGKNKKVDRYIPIDELRKSLVNGLGDKCDVNGMIDAYLEKEAKQSEIKLSKDMSVKEQKKAIEQDPSEVFNQGMNMLRESMAEKYENYDIVEMENLIYYEPGDTMPEDIKKCLGKSYNFYHDTLEEDDFTQLMNDKAQKRCAWLVEQNRSLLIRDKDWEKIFTDIKTNEESFGRYYPMVRVQISSDGIYDMIVAMILNDDFYKYCEELGPLYQESEQE